MDNYTFLLSDMDFFTECDPSKLVISFDNILTWDLEKCKGDINAFISQIFERYTVYCMETPTQNLINLILAHVNFKQQSLKFLRNS